MKELLEEYVALYGKDNWAWGSPINESTYQYDQGSYKDETRYQAGTGGLAGSYVVTVTNPSGSYTSYYYTEMQRYDSNAATNVKIDQVTKEIVKESSESNCDTITTEYTYASTYAVTSPSKVTTTEKIDGVENTTIHMYEYDANTSEIKKESLALTSDEITGSTIPSAKSIQYSYKKITNTINGVARDMYLLSTVTSYMDTDTQVVQRIEYDVLGNIISTEDAEGNLTQYLYGDTTYSWLPTKVWTRDPENKGNEDRKTEIQYVYSGNQGYGFGATKIIQLNGIEETGVTENDYDIRYGNVIAERVYTANNKYNEVNYVYNDLGLCTQISYPTYQDVNGENHYLTERYFYKTQPVYFNELKYREVYMCIQMNSTVDNSSSTTEWESSYYDDYGNLVFVDSFVNGEEEYFYDSVLRIVGYQNRRDYGTNNKTLSYVYDGFDRVTKVTDRIGNEYHADYKSLEIKYSFKENDKTELTNEYSEFYDNQGQVIKQRYYHGDTTIDTQYTYDLQGNVTSVTDGNGKVTSYEYNKFSQPIKVTQADGSVIETAYAKTGAATEIVRTTNDDSYAMTNRYDDRGQLREVSQKGTDITVPSWKYNYRMDGAIQTVTDPNGTKKTFGYDSSNHQTFYQSGSRSQYIYYNQYAKPSKIIQLDNQTASQMVEYTYNVAHKLTQKNVGGEVTRYSYDEYDSLTGIVSPNNLSRYYTLDEMERIEMIAADSSSLEYEYIGDNLIGKISYSYADIITTYQYDDMNRLTKLKTTTGTDTIVEYNYTYDNVGNVLSVSGSENCTYTYDDLYRLKTVLKDGVTTTYEYDSRNNLISEVTSKGKSSTYQYSGDNRLVQAVINGTTVNYEYDLNGNLIADSKGNEYAYDEDNRMIYSKVDGVETTYTIGVDGYRNCKQSGDDISTYSVDEVGHVISETDGYGKVTEIVWDGAHPVTRKVDGKYYYYIYNGHGDVVALVDENGDIQNEYSYSPWGEQTVKKENIDNPIGYAGEYQDRETGLTYLRARYYNPSVKRFVQEDPARDQWDWYVYCNNNPIHYKDSTGKAVETALDIVSIGWSIHDLVDDPSIKNFGFLIWDVAAAAIPFIPGSYAGKTIKAGTKILSKADDYKRTGVWAKKALDRGWDIEKALGGWCNNFPTIDKAVKKTYKNGKNFLKNIVSIKSMDTTAKTYQNASKMRNKLRKYIDDLANFSETTYKGTKWTVKGGTSRTLELAIPAVGLSKKQAKVLQEMKEYAKKLGVTLKVVIVK
ncbi:MAG: RHS repeat-associated core domain-containing protein, partial [Lachnospiraceae bacterium]